MLFSEHERRVLAEVEDDFRADAPRLAEMLRTGSVKRSPVDVVIYACMLMPGIGVFVLAVVAQSLGLLVATAVLLALSVPGARVMARIIDDSAGNF